MKAQKAGPSQRQLRVGEVVRQALSEVFTRGDVYNPLLTKTTMTVTEVRMSPDLKHAFAFISPLGQSFTNELKEALKEELPRLRQYIAKNIQLRSVPHIHFEEDKSFDEAQKINELLKKPSVAQDLT